MARRPLSDHRHLLVELELDETVLRESQRTPTPRRAATLRRAAHHERTPSPYKLKQKVLSSRAIVDDANATRPSLRQQHAVGSTSRLLIADAIRENAAQRSRVLLDLQDELRRLPTPTQQRRRSSNREPLLSPAAVKLLNRLRALTLSVVEMVRYYHEQPPVSSGDATEWACQYEFQQTLARISASDVDELLAFPVFACFLESLGASAVRNPMLDGVALDASELLLCSCQAMGAKSLPITSSSLFQLVVARLEAFAIRVRGQYPLWQTLPHDRVARALLDLVESETLANATRMLPSYLRPDIGRPWATPTHCLASGTDSIDNEPEQDRAATTLQAWEDPHSSPDPPRSARLAQVRDPRSPRSPFSSSETSAIVTPQSVPEVVSQAAAPDVAEPKALSLVADTATGSKAARGLAKKSSKPLRGRSVTLGSLDQTVSTKSSSLTMPETKPKREETKPKREEAMVVLTETAQVNERAASAVDMLPQCVLESVGISTAAEVAEAAPSPRSARGEDVKPPAVLFREMSPREETSVEATSTESVPSDDDDDEHHGDHGRIRAAIASALDALPQFSLESVSINTAPPTNGEEVPVVSDDVQAAELLICDVSPRAEITAVSTYCELVPSTDDDEENDLQRIRAAIAGALGMLPYLSLESVDVASPREIVASISPPPEPLATEREVLLIIDDEEEPLHGAPPTEPDPQACEIPVAAAELCHGAEKEPVLPVPVPVGEHHDGETAPLYAAENVTEPTDSAPNTSEMARILSLCRDVHVAAIDLGTRLHPSNFSPTNYHASRVPAATLSCRYLERELKMLRRCYRQWRHAVTDRHERVRRLRVACSARRIGRFGRWLLRRARDRQQRLTHERCVRMAVSIQRQWRRHCIRGRQHAFHLVHQRFQRFAFFTRVCRRQRRRHDAAVALQQWQRRVRRRLQAIERHRLQRETEHAATRERQALANEQTLRRQLAAATARTRRLHVMDNRKQVRARKDAEMQRQLHAQRLRDVTDSLQTAVEEMEAKWRQAAAETERLCREQSEQEKRAKTEAEMRTRRLARERIDRFLECSALRRRLATSLKANEAMVATTKELVCQRERLERRHREDAAKRLLLARMLRWKMDKQVQRERIAAHDALWQLQHQRRRDSGVATQRLHAEIRARVAQTNVLEYCGVGTQTLAERTYRSQLLAREDDAQRLQREAARERVAGFVQYCVMKRRLATVQREAEERRQREQYEADARRQEEREQRRRLRVREQSEWVVKHWLLHQVLRVRQKTVCETMAQAALDATLAETQRRVDAEREADRLKNENETIRQQQRRHEQLSKLQRRKLETKAQQLSDKHVREHDASVARMAQQHAQRLEELEQQARCERERQQEIEGQTRRRLVDLMVDTQSLATSVAIAAVASARDDVLRVVQTLTLAVRYRRLLSRAWQREACWRWRRLVLRRRQTVPAPTVGTTNSGVDPGPSRELRLAELGRAASARRVQRCWRAACERRCDSSLLRVEQADEADEPNHERISQVDLPDDGQVSRQDAAESTRTRGLRRLVRERRLRFNSVGVSFFFSGGRAWAATPVAATGVVMRLRFDRVVSRKLLHSVADLDGVYRSDLMRVLEELAWDLQPLVAAAPASARCVVDLLDGSAVLGDLDESELPRFALSTRQLSKTRSRVKRQRLLDAKTDRLSPSPSAPALTIFDAVESASLDDAQFLLLQGADLHAREPCHQRTALHMLAASRDAPLAARVAMLDFLLDRAKLDLHARDATGQSPLLAFATRGCLSLVEAVVARDAALWRATDHDGRNAFHGACAHDQPEVAAWLQHFVLQRTDASLTDLHARDASGSTPLHTLAARGHGECLDAVVTPLSDELRAALLQGRDASGCRPLHLAVAGGHVEVVRDLLRLGASPLVGDAWARRPLHYAGTMELMSLLVENGAELNAADARGDTALHYAADSGRGASVRHLLVLGADPTVLNSDWQRAAQVAASPDCTRLLLPSASASSVTLSQDNVLASAKSYCLPTAMEPPSKVARETLIDWDKLHADHDVELVDDCGHFSSDDEREGEWVSDDE